MSLSSHRQHKIYIAATMGYGLGSEDPEELALYKTIKKEKDMMSVDMIQFNKAILAIRWIYLIIYLEAEVVE